MRILFIGDMAPTGFGTVTQDLGREMIAQGMDVRFLSQNELGTLAEPFHSRTFVLDDRIGWQEAMDRGKLSFTGILDGSLWADGWETEAVLILGDFYAARAVVYRYEEAEAAFRSIPTYHYCPVEGVSLPPAWRHLWEFVHPVAMSGFGADEIAKVTGVRPPVVYHGIDTESFFPVSAKRPIRLGTETLRDKDECKDYFRSMFGISRDWQILLRTDTNVPRKQWPALFRSVAPVLATHPKAVLVMHTRTSDEGGHLLDLRSHFEKWPSVMGRIVNTRFKDNGYNLSRKELNALYNAADVYVSSGAEGFGLCIAESLAAGVPAVGLNYSSVPEVIGPAGLVVRSELVDNPYGHFWAKPYEEDGANPFGEAVARLLDDPRERLLMGAKGPHHVAQNFQWSQAARQMADVMVAKELVAA